MRIKSCHQESVIGGYMKGFKHGCLLGMIIVLGIAGWIWYTPNVWQQYWKECMLLCIFGVITGSVYYEVMLFKQREHRLQKEEEQRLLLQVQSDREAGIYEPFHHSEENCRIPP